MKTSVGKSRLQNWGTAPETCCFAVLSSLSAHREENQEAKLLQIPFCFPSAGAKSILNIWPRRPLKKKTKQKKKRQGEETKIVKEEIAVKRKKNREKRHHYLMFHSKAHVTVQRNRWHFLIPSLQLTVGLRPPSAMRVCMKTQATEEKQLEALAHQRMEKRKVGFVSCVSTDATSCHRWSHAVISPASATDSQWTLQGVSDRWWHST